MTKVGTDSKIYYSIHLYNHSRTPYCNDLLDHLLCLATIILQDKITITIVCSIYSLSSVRSIYDDVQMKQNIKLWILKK